MHNTRWDDLRIVLAVADHGSLSGASRALGINHSTVLRRIALLESAHEVRLFDRARDGYRLRPEGRVLLTSLRMMDRASEQVGRSLAVASKGVAGTFRLSTTDSIANVLLPRYVGMLRHEHPNARIEIAVSNLPVDMENPSAEILLRTGHKLPADLQGENVGTLTFGVFGAPEYLEEHSSKVVEDHRWLGVVPEFAHSTAGVWQFSKVGDNVDVSANSFLTLARLAASGLGLVVLPRFVGRSEAGLLPVEGFGEGPATGLWVATHPEFRNRQNIDPLIAFFSDVIRADDRLTV